MKKVIRIEAIDLRDKERMEAAHLQRIALKMKAEGRINKTLDGIDDESEDDEESEQKALLLVGQRQLAPRLAEIIFLLFVSNLNKTRNNREVGDQSIHLRFETAQWRLPSCGSSY